MPDDDMSTSWSHVSEDDLLSHTYDYSQPSLESCDEYPFGDSWIFSMKISNHPCAQILVDTRSWPAQSSLGLMLPNKSIFILRLLAGICR
jgi:hypothetical protein